VSGGAASLGSSVRWSGRTAIGVWWPCQQTVELGPGQ